MLRFSSIRRGLLSCVFISTICGCTASSSDDDGSLREAAQADRNGHGHHDGHPGHGHVPHGGEHDQHGHHHVRHPSGAYSADVITAGSGCPEGTTVSSITADGQAFVVLFDQYEADIQPGQSEDAKECTLQIQLGSEDGVQYAVAGFYYEGHVFLEKDGMKARRTARYGFEHHGENDADRDLRAGPVDEDYVYSKALDSAQLVWSACRRRNVLNVRTSLSVKNDPQSSGQGYVNATTAGGTANLKLNFPFRGCSNPED